MVSVRDYGQGFIPGAYRDDGKTILEAACGEDPDGEAALALAYYIEEANWEALELIAEWMNEAADKGNEEALDWLKEYYYVDPAEPYA